MPGSPLSGAIGACETERVWGYFFPASPARVRILAVVAFFGVWYGFWPGDDPRVLRAKTDGSIDFAWVPAWDFARRYLYIRLHGFTI